MAIAPRMPARRRKTSLENLFNALWRCPQGRAVSTLFTDGWENQETSNAFYRRSRPRESRFIPSCLPGRPAIANVAITKLLAPTQGNSGESLNVKVVLDNQNDRPVEGTLALTRNGQASKLSP